MSRANLNWRHLAAAGSIVLLAACAQQPTPVASNPPPVAPGPHSIWHTVAFDNNSFSVDHNGQVVINQVIDAMQRNPNAVATIIGKTDTVGSPDYNMHLSHQRADAVRDALVYGGHISADRVETRWTGERRPNVTTGNDVAAAANRVVDIAVH